MQPDGPNPLLAPWEGPLGAPPFDLFRVEDVIPALTAGIAEHEAELAAIRDETAPPDFHNVIAALELSGERLSRVSRIFWTLSSAQADDAIRELEGEVSAMLSRHGAATSHDAKLFGRVAAIYTTRHAMPMSPDERRLVETVHDGFVRGGAALAPADKARLAAIDERLGELSVAFGQAVQSATNDWTMLLTGDDLAGLPEPVRDSAAARATRAGHPGLFQFGLDRTDFETFLGFSERRDLRERIWRGFTSRCDGGLHDNNVRIAEIVALRDESAKLLGYPHYAAMKLEDSMAATPEAASALLLRVWEPAKRRAAEEAAELQALIDADGGGFTLAAWDWRFYAERIRRERFALDGAAIKQHLRLDAVRQAAFKAAGGLYGLHFTRRDDVPVYHPQVDAWEVTDASGAPAGLVYTDYIARPEKRGGAWMGSLRVQEKLDGVIRPIVYTVANFAGGEDTRLSLDEARTLFHEFGHALHGLLSDVTYPSQAGTSVARDFVEFPSKFMEHWILDRDVLAGFGVPDTLIDAIGRAETYGQGFATVELAACALVDLELHKTGLGGLDAAAFAQAELDRLDMPSAIGMRHRLPYFTHVFDGGYASAYYSYLWSEVLDGDAFEAFVEQGDLFDARTALRFRTEILARGDTRDPMESFIAFRGRPPSEEPLLRARGLLQTAS